MIFSVPVLLVHAGACLVTGLLAGVLPAWHLVREDPAEPLKEGGRSPVSLKRALRFGLIVIEVALTSLLLVGAGLTLRSFQAVLAQPAGIETEQPPDVPDRPAGRALQGSARGGALLQRARIATGGRADDPGRRRHDAAAADRTRRTPRRRDREPRRSVPDDGPTRAHPRVVTSNYLQAVGARDS